MTSSSMPWHHLAEPENIPSPSLLVFPDRIRKNIRSMITTAGGVNRLRPHVKTHKMPRVLNLMQEQGLSKFKCATLAELEMCLQAGVEDALLAYPAVGPNVAGLLQLVAKYPQAHISTTADDAHALALLNEKAKALHLTVRVFLDLDCGQHRTGLPPGPQARDLYRHIMEASNLSPGGLHIYDGHLHEPDPAIRQAQWEKAMKPCWEFHDELVQSGMEVPVIVAGGTPTFPFHAKQARAECSPGTCVFWDAGYGTHFKDLDFEPAAAVFARIISKPGSNLLCLDLGHKSIAAENPHPRVVFPDLSEADPVSHSEEHLVLETKNAHRFPIGQGLVGIPWHICPTVALYGEAIPILNHSADAPWKISARERLSQF